MRLRRLKPAEKRRDAALTCVLMVSVVALGYAIGVGWAGAYALVVIGGQWLIERYRERRSRRRVAKDSDSTAALAE
jgi:hypothetical protein